jgi:hypothetical protein
MQSLYLVRGLPGSGKTTWVKSQMAILHGRALAYHYEADQFFVGADGKYNFNPSNLSLAHETCRTNVIKTLAVSQQARTNATVFVANTMTTWGEVEPIVKSLSINDVIVTVVDITTQYGSVHDVPYNTILRMKKRFVGGQVICSHLIRMGFTTRYVSV